MLKLAQWCLRHRKSVLAMWLLVLVAAFGLKGAIGARTANNWTLPGTESQKASDLLSASFPRQAGDQDQIVFAARGGGTLTGSRAKAAIVATLAAVARLPHVTAVSSPYTRAGSAISRDGTIGFATVSFDERGNVLPKAAIQRVVATASRARSRSLEVEFQGAAVALVSQKGPGATTAIGILAAIVVLLLSFGSLLAMGMPIATALLGLGTGVGIIGIASRAVDMPDFATELALMIGLGVGIDYALFILTRYRDAYRENGGNVQAAIADAMNTSGRAVIFAGITVVIALLGMLALGVSLLSGAAIAASLGVLLVLAASLTLLPALIGFFGHKVGRAQGFGRFGRRRRRAPAGFWERWIAAIQRRPWLAAIASGGLMLALAAPALGMRQGSPDASTDPAGSTTHKAYELIAKGFGQGFSGPLTVVVKLARPGDRVAAGALARAVAGTPGVARLASGQLSPGGRIATFVAYPTTSAQSRQTVALIDRLRGEVIPPVARSTGTTVYIGGFTAGQIDFSHILAGKLALFIGIVVALSAILLAVVFRSLVIPIQAAVMNLLSIGASMGVSVAIFQDGWLGGPTGPISAFIPVMAFAIVFGLSMDYEVFLVSRIHEEWERGGDAAAAVRTGVARTGRVITAAGSVMVVVFGSFISGGDHVIELFGTALACAVFLDAVVVRMVLLPAVLQLLEEHHAALAELPGAVAEPALEVV